ncbi:MAG TPA: hypothetical protein DCR04_08030 [Flavobacteriales bacterium]|nr:hypothetical protein [Flavobacteriales bacterium]
MSVTTNKRYYLRIILLLILFICAVKQGFSSVSVNSCLGAITISVTSGVLPYSYVWRDDLGNVLPYTSFVASGLAAGDYSVEVTEGNGDSTGPAT